MPRERAGIKERLQTDLITIARDRLTERKNERVARAITDEDTWIVF